MRLAIGFYLCLAVTLFAQDVAHAPTPDADDVVVVASLTALARVSSQACQELPEVKQYRVVLAQATKRIEEKYQGFTLSANHVIVKK